MSNPRAASALLSVFAAVSLAQDAAPRPGMVNNVEGRVTVDGQAAIADGTEAAALAAGHELQTGQGRAEVLLTPGVFLRVAENSAIKMDAVSERNVKVEVVRGEALVEVAQVDPHQTVDMVDQGAETRLDHKGIYLFNATQPAVAVYSGKARVEDDRRVVPLRQGEELALGGSGALKPQKFDRAETDGIYAWSLQRADYEAQASEYTAEALLTLEGRSAAAGWHWNPWYRTWAFIPAAGYQLSPFGYGYYAPYMPHARTPIFGDFR
jgi:hypothetical protein